MYIELGNLVKYVKSHGFVTFDIKKFYLLTRINPYLYKFSDTEHCSTYLMTFKLNGLEIDKRLESTRRRMTQVSTPELFTWKDQQLIFIAINKLFSISGHTIMWAYWIVVSLPCSLEGQQLSDKAPVVELVTMWRHYKWRQIIDR